MEVCSEVTTVRKWNIRPYEEVIARTSRESRVPSATVDPVHRSVLHTSTSLFVLNSGVASCEFIKVHQETVLHVYVSLKLELEYMYKHVGKVCSPYLFSPYCSDMNNRSIAWWLRENGLSQYTKILESGYYGLEVRARSLRSSAFGPWDLMSRCHIVSHYLCDST